MCLSCASDLDRFCKSSLLSFSAATWTSYVDHGGRLVSRALVSALGLLRVESGLESSPLWSITFLERP